VSPDEREQMQILCERIAKEQDGEKFSELVSQMNQLFEKKTQRLEAGSTKPAMTRSG
jgi:hypothetical protein